MSLENPTWGAPRIHGELLKLGIKLSEPTVAKYMVRSQKPPSQSWKTFLKNHMQNSVSVDFFTVHTATFKIPYVFLILSHKRRKIVHFNVIGSIRRECLDHMIIFGERHLRKALRDYCDYYHASRPHLGLGKDCPEPREVEPAEMGKIIAIPQVGGLHHRYTRIAA